MRLLLVLRFGISTALLGAALTFITNAVKSWNNTPSVTSGELTLENIIIAILGKLFSAF